MKRSNNQEGDEMRYFFDEISKLRINDIRGRDFRHDDEAIAHARRLAADLRSLEPLTAGNKLSICVLSEHGNTIHEEMVFSK